MSVYFRMGCLSCCCSGSCYSDVELFVLICQLVLGWLFIYFLLLFNSTPSPLIDWWLLVWFSDFVFLLLVVFCCCYRFRLPFVVCFCSCITGWNGCLLCLGFVWPFFFFDVASWSQLSACSWGMWRERASNPSSNLTFWLDIFVGRRFFFFLIFHSVHFGANVRTVLIFLLFFLAL